MGTDSGSFTTAPLKRCYKCGKKKPATGDFFTRAYGKVDTLCLMCNRAAVKASKPKGQGGWKHGRGPALTIKASK